MVKCKFVGKIVINATINENEPGLLPYPEMKENWAKAAEVIRECIVDELGEEFNVSVEEIENSIEHMEESRRNGE